MRLRTTTTLLLALAAGLVVGCGSDDEEEGSPIPEQAAAELQGQLDSIQGRFESPEPAACADVTEGDDTNTAVVQRVIGELPNDVDADVRDALEQSFQRLFELVERECGEKQEVETEPAPEPAPLPEPETDTTETEPAPPPTETTPPETTPEPPPETEEEPVLPPGQGGEPPGQGGENPGQGGGGGAITPEDDG